MWLGSYVAGAVAVVQAFGYSSDWTLSLGTSMDVALKSQKKKKTEKTETRFCLEAPCKESGWERAAE